MNILIGSFLAQEIKFNRYIAKGRCCIFFLVALNQPYMSVLFRNKWTRFFLYPTRKKEGRGVEGLV